MALVRDEDDCRFNPLVDLEIPHRSELIARLAQSLCHPIEFAGVMIEPVQSGRIPALHWRRRFGISRRLPATEWSQERSRRRHRQQLTPRNR
jgi:hypothetical protein